MTKDDHQQAEFCQKFACELQTCLDSKGTRLFKNE